MSSSMEECFNCPICFDICDDPVESSCCGNLYCKECSDRLNECSFCRSKCTFKSSIAVKRMINKLPAKCSYCDYNCARGDLKIHYEKCDKFPINCPIETCKESLVKSALLEHLTKNHKEEVMKNLDYIINAFSKSKKVTESITQAVPDFQFMASNMRESSSNTQFSVDKMKNDRGDYARLGATGKYYCGKKLEKRCGCCDGNCGINAGCNCNACMKLDLKARNLPKGWLVNRDGFVSRKGLTGQYYCGRKVLLSDSWCDGWCGPTNGPSCDACKTLDKLIQANNLYANLV